MKLDNSLCEHAREEASRLDFQSADDAQRRLCELSKNWDDTLAAHRRWVVESYIQGKCYVAGRVQLRSDDFEFDVIFRFPPASFRLSEPRTASDEICGFSSGENWREQRVFVPIAHFVYVPKDRIPSVVSLERPQTRSDFLRHRYAPIDRIGKAVSVFTERKGTRSESRHSAIKGSDSPDSVVKCGTDVSECVADDKRELIQRERFWQADFVNLVSHTSVFVGNGFQFMVIAKADELGVQLRNVMLCSAEF